jgi:hypothetical protein
VPNRPRQKCCPSNIENQIVSHPLSKIKPQKDNNKLANLPAQEPTVQCVNYSQKRREWRREVEELYISTVNSLRGLAP